MKQIFEVLHVFVRKTVAIRRRMMIFIVLPHPIINSIITLQYDSMISSPSLELQRAYRRMIWSEVSKVNAFDLDPNATLICHVLEL